MPETPTTLDPARFGLNSFADLLRPRAPIIGEDPGSFEIFHRGMMQSLKPLTPYEGVIAENLIDIEWSLLQHRRMRDADLRKFIREAICKAVRERELIAHEDAMDEDWDKHIEAGGSEDDWEMPFSVDEKAAEDAGIGLATRAISRDPEVQRAACDEIEAMGLNVVDLMSEAHVTTGAGIPRHSSGIQYLERRRRDVKNDFDTLQKARPTEPKTVDGQVIVE